MGLLTRLRVFRGMIETKGDSVEQARVPNYSGSQLSCRYWHRNCVLPPEREFPTERRESYEHALVFVFGHAAGSRECRPALCSATPSSRHAREYLHAEHRR